VAALWLRDALQRESADDPDLAPKVVQAFVVRDTISDIATV
jgi:hypothetical protein